VRRNVTKRLHEASRYLKRSCFMVCQQLDELEWDFVQARAESCDIDSLGWTDREFSCLVAILDHKREGHQGEPCLRD
jgi:hypothetical protein